MNHEGEHGKTLKLLAGLAMLFFVVAEHADMNIKVVQRQLIVLMVMLKNNPWL